ncbi:hypothetical protein [Amycolatopsis sp. NPDC049868]|uniref:hypothetical protein n=1 Tax=Amycolatopsis sp. NPDC049868 TaxID=3363934 RepID=UPI0037A649A2
MVGQAAEAGLSRYTANIAAYLDHCGSSDRVGRLAASIRFGMDLRRADGLVAVSHHNFPLNRLGDGSRLLYGGCVDFAEVRRILSREIERHGCALVVGRRPAESRRPGREAGFLLIDGLDADRWHVEDRFVEAGGEGTAAPFRDWIRESELAELMAVPHRGSEPNRIRTVMAFGYATPVPAGTRYLVVRRRSSAATVEPPDRWNDDSAAALDRLGDRISRDPDLLSDPCVLHGCWTAAQHHLFRCRFLGEQLRFGTTRVCQRRVLHAAARRWSRLPYVVRSAAISSREVSRVSAACDALHELAEAETEVDSSAAGALTVLRGTGD